jgi:hypothetical protein
MTTPNTPAELIRQAADRHQAARDAAAQVSEEIAAKRVQDAAKLPPIVEPEQGQ